jgi:hypothetical protein
MGCEMRLALQELGPIFVKFGQILSTRRDLLPPDIADELALLQDRVRRSTASARATSSSTRWASRRDAVRRVRHHAAGLGLDRAGARGARWTAAARWWSRCCARASSADRRRHRVC